MASLALLAVAAPSFAQVDPGEIVVHVYVMRHQSAGEALDVIKPLLSPRGRFEVSNAENTLVLHDSAATIAGILPVLVAFDHPAQPVDVELWLVRASGSKVSPPIVQQAKGVPADLMRSLSEHFPYQHYSVIGSSKVRGTEGEQMTFQVGGGYAVRFRLGTVVSDQRLKLNDFEVVLIRGNGDPVALPKSLLNVWIEKPYVLALSSREPGSAALMVVVRCRAAIAVGAHPTPRPRASSPRSPAPGRGWP